MMVYLLALSRRTMPGNDTSNRSVKTAETVFEIVEVLSDAGEASLTTLARRLDMPRSTLHTYLATLLELDYLRKEDDTYRLGLKFLDHGARVQRNEPLYEASAPFLEQVSNETKEIVWVVTEEHGQAVCLRKAEGERAIQPYKRVGGRLTMHDIAAGKAILAELDDERVREIIDAQGLPARTEHTITDIDDLFAELEEIRETGVAFNDGESMEGFRAVASPICPGETPYGSLVVSGPKNRIRDDRFRKELPEIVSGATNALELNLVSE
jgi:DNA-binding IclR family transcriptional regulator